MRKKWLIASFVAVSVASFSCLAFAEGPNHLLEATKNRFEANDLQKKVYSETPFVLDMDKQISMNSPATIKEAQTLHSKVYSETPFIKRAAPGTGIDSTKYGIGIASVSLPYYFSFDFDSNLSSANIEHNASGTVRITANADWDQKPNQYDGTDKDYYDVTLYAGGKAQGTYRFDTGSWQHADWYNVPKDSSMFFTMTKHVATWSGAPYPDYDGDISGSGAVVIP